MLEFQRHGLLSARGLLGQLPALIGKLHQPLRVRTSLLVRVQIGRPYQSAVNRAALSKPHGIWEILLSILIQFTINADRS